MSPIADGEYGDPWTWRDSLERLDPPATEEEVRAILRAGRAVVLHDAFKEAAKGSREGSRYRGPKAHEIIDEVTEDDGERAHRLLAIVSEAVRDGEFE